MIVVTGIGLVTPLGSTREKTWSRLINGEHGLTPTPHGLEGRVFDFSPNGARSRMGDFAILAAAEALAHAGLDPKKLRGQNIGCAMSQSKPLVLHRAPKTSVSLPNGEGNRNSGEALELDSTLLLASFFGWSAESVVQREFGLAGPTENVVAACATGIASIQTGAHWIRSGLCDIAIVGAAESSLNSFYRAGFEQMGVLADGYPKPFDRDRNGFVMGEGSAALVLESEASAKARGRQPIARLLSAHLGQSADDALRFDSDGSAVAKLIAQSTREFGIPSYINAHGTGTVVNDVVETRGIKKAFKDFQSIAVSSTKAATGHLLGAAGAVEAAFAVLALRDQVAPPTLNLTNTDPECNLNLATTTLKRDISSALSLSYGFGGQMGAVLFGTC